MSETESEKKRLAKTHFKTPVEPPQYVDLHCHSTASDGSLSPTDVVRMAKANGLTGLALTDHDTIGGCAEAAAEAARQGIEFIPGIEISSEFPKPGTMHLLGYGVDMHSPVLTDLTRRLIEGRTGRNEKMVAAMQAEGIAVTLEELLAEAGGGTIGRPHLAAILVRKGYCSSVQNAFDRYLGQGGKFYFDKETITPKRAIEMIKQAGGVSVLAHPVQLRRENNAQLETVIKELVDYGMDGVEIIHSDHGENQINFLSELATRWGLLKTGGSDFHGKSKPSIKLGYAGNRRIPKELFDRLKERLKANV